jgi:hypothetical protein
MYQSLKRLGVETQLVVYPDSHHGGWKKQFNRDYYERALAWMDKYVKAESVVAESTRSKADNKLNPTDLKPSHEAGLVKCRLSTVTSPQSSLSSR